MKTIYLSNKCDRNREVDSMGPYSQKHSRHNMKIIEEEEKRLSARDVHDMIILLTRREKVYLEEFSISFLCTRTKTQIGI